MTIYTVISPQSQNLGWHSTKKDAWKKAKKVYKASEHKAQKPTKKELKALGYKLDEHTGELGSADEQMMLMGR